MQTLKRDPSTHVPARCPFGQGRHGHGLSTTAYLQLLNWACVLLISNGYTGNEREATTESASAYKYGQLNANQQQTLQPCHSYGISSMDVLKISQHRVFHFVQMMLVSLLSAFSERKLQRAEGAR